jgi:hypothetical protein
MCIWQCGWCSCNAVDFCSEGVWFMLLTPIQKVSVLNLARTWTILGLNLIVGFSYSQQVYLGIVPEP